MRRNRNMSSGTDSDDDSDNFSKSNLRTTLNNNFGGRSRPNDFSSNNMNKYMNAKPDNIAFQGRPQR